MELEKQKNISRVIHNTLKRFEDFPEDVFKIKPIDLKYVLEYAVFLEEELNRLQKENEEYSKQLDLDYVDENFVNKDKIRELIENETLNIANFKCIALEDVQDLLKEE